MNESTNPRKIIARFIGGDRHGEIELVNPVQFLQCPKREVARCVGRELVEDATDQCLEIQTYRRITKAEDGGWGTTIWKDFYVIDSMTDQQAASAIQDFLNAGTAR